jgi:hypothetical protein
MKEKHHGHKKHDHHPHDKMAAMPQFNEGHWEKKPADVEVGGSRYSSGEMNQCEEYKKDVDGLAHYVRKHKAQH